jgi:hypothetical protein
MISATQRRTISASSGRAAPDPPTHVRQICDGAMFTAAQASRIARCKDCRAIASPTRTMLLAPAVAVARVRDSSPIAHVVLVPPPSMPR